MTDEMLEEYEEVLTLTDENGVESDYVQLDMISYEEQDYIVLAQADALEGDGEEDVEVLILKVDPAEDGDDADLERFSAVEDEELLNKLFDLFKTAY
ncbi:MAG: DUF1292 domain-containing protein, partial [Butyricicoccaceae bacterium]